MGSTQSHDNVVHSVLGCCTGEQSTRRTHDKQQNEPQQPWAFQTVPVGYVGPLDEQRKSWAQSGSTPSLDAHVAHTNQHTEQVTQWFRTPKDERDHVMDQPIINEDDRPLFHAARIGDVETVDALLLRGIDADERDEYGRSPLHYAAWNGSMAVVKRLIKDGAELKARTHDGVSPADCAYETGQLGVGHFLALQHMGLTESQMYYRFEVEGYGKRINSTEDKQRLTMAYFKREMALASTGMPEPRTKPQGKNTIEPKDTPPIPKRMPSSLKLQTVASFKDRDNLNLKAAAAQDSPSGSSPGALGSAALKPSASFKRASQKPASPSSPTNKLSPRSPASPRANLNAATGPSAGTGSGLKRSSSGQGRGSGRALGRTDSKRNSPAAS